MENVSIQAPPVSSEVAWAPDRQQISAMRKTNHDFYLDYYKRRHLLNLRYDYIYRRRILRDFLIRHGLQSQPLKVLDLGFGNCNLLFSLNRSCELHGVEISNSAVELARRRATEKGYRECRFQQYDLHELIPYPDETFDLVICSHVLEHIDNDLALLQDMRRVLKPDGHVLIFIPIHEELVYANGDKHIQKYTIERFVGITERCRLAVTEILEHQFFDRPFKLFAPFGRRFGFLNILREVTQYTSCFLAVHTCAPLLERVLQRSGCKPTSLFMALHRNT